MRWPLFPFKRCRGAPELEQPEAGSRPATPGATRALDMDAGTLLNLLPAYVTVLDRQYRILQANDTFVKDFGEAVGRTCFSVAKGRQERCDDCPMDRTLNDGRECSWEETLRTIHQETVHTIAHATPVVDAQGRITGAIKVLSDISEEKQLHRQLELSQQEYKTLFHTVPCYITIQDRDLNIIKTNRSFERDFGRGKGRRCYEVYKARDSSCPNCPLMRTFEDGQVNHSEETVRLTNGRTAQMVVSSAPLYDLTGNIFAAMEISTNITEVVRLQRELSTLGQAVAVTAHAIKNILNGLTGGAYVVQSGLKRGDAALAQQGWEMVKEGVDMVGQLVKDILMISKERTPEVQETDPNQLAKGVWKLFERRAEDLGIQLILEPDHRAYRSRWLDSKGVHTVLSNLVSNALDACASDESRQDHSVILRVKDLGDEGVCFEVEDDGPGIAGEIRDRLFQEVISTKGSSGTGLGLMVTQKIVKEHGGSITLDSDPLTGTCFRVRLPCSRQREDESPSVGPPPPQGLLEESFLIRS